MARDEEVLRRRARFVATALVLAGCTKEKPSSVEPLPSQEGKPTTTTSATTLAPSPGVAEPPDRPALTAKVSPAAQKDLEARVKVIDDLYVAIKKTASALPPKCDLAEADCLAKVRAYVLLLGDHKDAIPDAPRCPPKGADALALEKLRDDHARWFGKWLKLIDERLDSQYASSADAGGVLAGLRMQADQAHPQPCLKYSCPP